MKRNWAMICQLKDPWMRIAVSLAMDESTLRGLQKGFPACFVEGGEDTPLCVPLSALMAAAEVSSLSSEENAFCASRDKHFWLDMAFNLYPHLSIPISHSWCEAKGTPVPDGVLQQLVGQKAQAGLMVQWAGKTHLVINICIDDKEGSPEIGSVFTKQPVSDELRLVEARFLALDK